MSEGGSWDVIKDRNQRYVVKYKEGGGGGSKVVREGGVKCKTS